jgi:hypothetical protein
VAKADLTGFFEAWGMLTPLDVVLDDYGLAQLKITQVQITDVKEYTANYPALEPAIQYIRDDNTELYRPEPATVKGTFTDGAATVTLRNWKNVVALEKRNADGQLVCATSKMSIIASETDQKVYAVSAAGERVAVE